MSMSIIRSQLLCHWILHTTQLHRITALEGIHPKFPRQLAQMDSNNLRYNNKNSNIREYFRSNIMEQVKKLPKLYVQQLRTMT